MENAEEQLAEQRFEPKLPHLALTTNHSVCPRAADAAKRAAVLKVCEEMEAKYHKSYSVVQVDRMQFASHRPPGELRSGCLGLRAMVLQFRHPLCLPRKLCL